MSDDHKRPSETMQDQQFAKDRDERVLTHIKAVIEALKETAPEQLAAPAGLFISGLLGGLAAAGEIVKGGTAEDALESVNTRLATAIGEAYIAGTLPPSTNADSADGQLSKEEEIRGVQGWMAMDLHRALGLTVRGQSTHQGHPSWADWWANLMAQVNQRTLAIQAYARAQRGDLEMPLEFSVIAVTRGVDPKPVDLFFPFAYGVTVAAAHPATPSETPYMIDVVGVSDGNPIREETRRLIMHRSLVNGMVRDIEALEQTGQEQGQASPVDEQAVARRRCGPECAKAGTCTGRCTITGT